MSDKDDKKEGVKAAAANLAEKAKLKGELNGLLMAGRLQAKTETATRIKVRSEDQKASKTKPAVIPPPGRAPAAPAAPAPASKTKGGKPVSTWKKMDLKKRVAWDRKRLQKFLSGIITLAELEGISKDEQYEMAKIGHQHLRQGKLESAKKVFDGLVALDPRDAYFHLALGSIAQRANELEEADKRYSTALDLNPFNTPARANRGEVRMMLGRLVEGAQDLLRAVQEDSEERHASTKRARVTLALVRTQLEEAGVPGGNAVKVAAAKIKAAKKVVPGPKAKGPAPRK